MAQTWNPTDGVNTKAKKSLTGRAVIQKLLAFPVPTSFVRRNASAGRRPAVDKLAEEMERNFKLWFSQLDKVSQRKIMHRLNLIFCGPPISGYDNERGQDDGKQLE